MPYPDDAFAPSSRRSDSCGRSSRARRRSSDSAAVRSPSRATSSRAAGAAISSATKTLMFARARRLARAARAARGHVRGLRRGAGDGGSGRDPAVRLLGGPPLAGRDYAEFAAPYSRRVLEAVAVPTIHFGTGTAGILSHMRDAGGDVIGLDWRVELDRGWAAVGLDRGVQGNLDPAALLGPWERVETAARTCSRGGRPPRPCVQPRPRRAAGTDPM